MKNKLKALLIPLSLVSLSMVPLANVTYSTIETYDTSPAKSRENQVRTEKGYKAHSETISATIKGVEYKNIEASVYITDTLYLYENLNNNTGTIKTYGYDSTALNFYVQLDMSNAVNATTGTAYTYTLGDENFFMMNLYPSSYDNYSSTTAASYETDIMSAKFYKDATVTTGTTFTSYQISVPKVEMGYEVEILNDKDVSNPDFTRDNTTTSIMSEDFLISDYYPTIFDLDYRGYNGNQYSWGDYDYLIAPYYKQSDIITNFNSTTSSFELTFKTYFDYTANEKVGLTLPNGYYLTGWLTFESKTTDTNYVVQIINRQSPSTVLKGIENTTEAETQSLGDYDSYVLYYNTKVELLMDGTANQYESVTYSYSTATTEDMPIYYNESLPVSDLWTESGSTSTTQLQAEVNFTENVNVDLAINIDPNYSEYDSTNDRYYTRYYSDQQATEDDNGYMYSNAFNLYEKNDVYNSINNTPSIDNSGDTANTIIGWLFIGLAVISIASISAYYFIYSKKKIDKNKEEFEQLNEELKKGDVK